MIKKAIIIVLMFAYLYTLAFSIFLTVTIRIPSPFIFGLTLIFLFKLSDQKYLYKHEAIVIVAANLVYYAFALSNFPAFAINVIIAGVCLLYFNYFVGSDKKRFMNSVFMFFGLLSLSTIIMLLNHVYPAYISQLRSTMLDGTIEQSPSGLAIFIFNFGYQLAPLVTFLFITSVLYSRFWVIKIAVLMACLIAVYFGMQRSVVVGFAVSGFLFLICYYKYKALPIIAVIGFFVFLFSTYLINSSSSNYDNIFSKNERNAEEDRGSLMTENLNIYSSYPFGLMFYGKNWNDVTKYNKIYEGGITSHNAYLMFFTYIGPFFGLGFLILLYYKIGKIFKTAIKGIKNKDNALLVSLCFSLLAVSLNSFFHNDWLLAGNGVTIFIYFAILHLYNNNNYQDVGSEEYPAI